MTSRQDVLPMQTGNHRQTYRRHDRPNGRPGIRPLPGREYEDGQDKANAQVSRIDGSPYCPRTRRQVHSCCFAQNHADAQKEEPWSEQECDVLPHCNRYEVVNDTGHNKCEY